MRKNWIVVDLDGTLCDHSHRIHHAVNRDYETYHGELGKDELHLHIRMIVKGFLNLDPENNALLLTGRNEAWRTQTLHWLDLKNVAHFFDHLLMRSDKNWEPDHELKLRMLLDYFGGHFGAQESVAFILEDRDKVVRAFRDMGFKCLQVAQGDF